MKLKNALFWGTGIAGILYVVDTMRIRKWITLPISGSLPPIPIPKGRLDIRFTADPKITGEPGAYQIEIPSLEVIDKLPSPHVVWIQKFSPYKLPEEVKSRLSLFRIYLALSKIKITTTETEKLIWVHINIPKNIKVPIYW